MKSSENNGRPIGFLFLVPLLTYGIGSALITAVLDLPDAANAIAQNNVQLVTGGILVLANSITVVLIGILLYPVLEEINKRIAIGYLSARIAESLLLLIGLTGLLTLIPLSTYAVGFEINYIMIREIQFLSYQFAMILLGIGSIPFCLLLYRAQLIPRFVSALGVVGYGLLAVGALAELYGYEIGILLSVPGGIFEITIAIWLLVKGFNNAKRESINLS